MRKTSFISNSKDIPWAFVGCFLALLIVEILIRTNIDRIRITEDAIIIQKQKYLLTNTIDYNCLMLGDSRFLGVNAKISSDIISEKLKTDINCFNYSLPNHGIQGYYFLLKKYLSEKRAPQFIVFSSAPFALTDNWHIENPKMPKSALYRFAHLFSVRDALESFKTKIFLRILLIKLENRSYLITYRALIKQLFKNPAGTIDMAQFVVPSIKNKNGGVIYDRTNIKKNKENNGVSFHVMPVTLEEVLKSDLYKQLIIINKESVEWLNKFFSLAEKNKIKVFILNAPLVEDIYNKRQLDGSNANYISQMDKFKDDFDNITFIKPLLEPYPLELFSDSQHLNRNGVARFTIESAEKIAEALTNGPH
jgi:hypothetical protein